MGILALKGMAKTVWPAGEKITPSPSAGISQPRIQTKQASACAGPSAIPLQPRFLPETSATSASPWT